MNNSNNIYDGNDEIELESVKDDTDDEVNDFCLSRFVNPDDNIELFDAMRFSTNNSSSDINTYVPIHINSEMLNGSNIFLYGKYLYVHTMIPGMSHSLSSVRKPGKD